MKRIILQSLAAEIKRLEADRDDLIPVIDSWYQLCDVLRPEETKHYFVIMNHHKKQLAKMRARLIKLREASRRVKKLYDGDLAILTGGFNAL